MFSNRYIFVYTAIMVVVVAALLSAASLFLAPAQDANVKIEKMQNILRSAGITCRKQEAQDVYTKSIVKELLVNKKGEVADIYLPASDSYEKGSKRAFTTDLKVEFSKGEEGLFPVFVCKKESENIYILPMQGKGLWGPIWGYIALEEDLTTVVGVTLDHKGETPGLGAEIASIDFQARFKGKKINDEDQEFVSITLVKGGVANSNIPLENAVDAISGGTITSDGVNEMLKDCLQNYHAYFLAFLKEKEEKEQLVVAIDSLQPQELIDNLK